MRPTFRLLLAAFVILGSPRANGQQGDEPVTQAISPSRRTPGGDPTILSDDTLIRLPWSEISKLLERIRRARRDPVPFTFALGAANAEGEMSGRLFSVRFTVRVSLMDDEWCAIPLWRAPVVVKTATLDGKPAAVALENGLAVLLAKGKGDHTFQADLVVAPRGNNDQALLGFATPVSVSWRLRLPGTSARIEPSVRQTTSPRAGGITLEALTPPAESISIDWTATRVSATSARVSAESFTYVTFQEGTTFGRSTILFHLSGGSRERLSVRLPADMELLTASSRDLSDWSVEEDGKQKKLTLSFVRPQRGRLVVDLGFELPKPVDSAELPSLIVDDVAEQRAWLAASAESPISITPGPIQGGEAIDVKNLPAHLLRDLRLPFSLAWRHSGEGFSGKVKIARHATVVLPQATIDAAYFTTVLTPEGEEVVKATFLMKNNLKPYLTVTLPNGSLLWAAFVSGESVSPTIEGGKVSLPLVKSREVGEGGILARHQVARGWSLSDIALQYYHDASKWRLIQAENEAVLAGSEIAQAGQTLVIPRQQSGPTGADLETAFPVEIVYSRRNKAPGFAGTLAFEVPATDLSVMSAAWTVYLPSTIDPLHFSGNISQTSHIRYGIFRRIGYFLSLDSSAFEPALFASRAYAGDTRSFRKKFDLAELEEVAEAKSYPRASLPLTGDPYVFRKDLLQGEHPHLAAVYVARHAEPPFRWAALALGLALGLWLSGVTGRRPSTTTAVASAGIYIGMVLLVGHFILGTHGRALIGLSLGVWFSLAIALFRRPLPDNRLQRIWHRVLKYGNPLAMVLFALFGLSWFTGFLGISLTIAGIVSLWLTSGRSKRLSRAAGAGTAAIALFALPFPARSQDLPPDAQVTIPFSQLKGLFGREPKPRPPPRTATLLDAEYSAVLEGESIGVDCVIDVEVHSETWVAVPLVGRSNALSKLLVDGRPGTAQAAGDRYNLAIKGVGRHRIELSFTSSAKAGVASLDLVPGVIGRLVLRMPAAGMLPQLARATEVQVEGATLRGLLPVDGRAELEWSAPRTTQGQQEGAKQEKARIVARTLQIISADERRVRIYAAVRFRVERGGESRFAIRLPDGIELLDVQGEGIAEHSVDTQSGRTLLQVTTASLIRDELEVSFVYDVRLAKEGGVLPVFQVEGVRSETGVVGIESAGNLEVKLAGVDGASAIDVRGAPELFAHTDKPILHAIRYLQHPYTVRLAFVAHAETELDTATVDRASYTTVVSLDGRAVTKAILWMRNARQSFLQISLPEGKGLESDPLSVLVGNEPAKPVRDAQGKLLLPLMRSPSGEGEMQQFEVEVVYLTKLGDLPRSGDLAPILPSVGLRVSEVEWSLYLPPGFKVADSEKSEQPSDHMQWATAPRASWSRPATRGEREDAIVTGGPLPVRFNLRERGTPTQFWRHYLPAGERPVFRVAFGPRSMHPAAQVALALGLAAMIGLGAWLASRVRRS